MIEEQIPQRENAFSMVELLVVVAIVAILAAIALPNYNKMKEQAVDREAIANLKLLQAAQKIYRMEIGFYEGPDSSVTTLNTNLKLDLNNKNWGYSTAATTGQATATRAGGARSWSLGVSDTGDPCCSGSDCPADATLCS